MINFISTNIECIRHNKKCDDYYYIGGGFDPIKDLNVEFIFSQGMTLLNLAFEEKISSVI